MKKRSTMVFLLVLVASGCGKKKGDAEPRGSGAASGSAAAPAPDAAAPSPPPSPPPPAADPALVERGAYLANVLGCGFCHMPLGPNGPDFSRLFAGGLEVPEQFGTWRAPNITPHKTSGIGAWTDDQIIAAVREGLRPDGSHLYPIMPYLNYNRMTDADARALVAFLRSLPPIDNVVAPTKDLKLPQLPAPKPANAPDDVADPVKHGEYLVTLMHCNMCHAKPGPDGMPDMSEPFSGGGAMELPPMFGTGTLYAANLTSDPDTGLGKWSEAQLATAVKTLTRPDGTIIQGPMQFYLAGWSKLTDPDVQAIAAYLKQIPPKVNKVPASTFKPAPPPGAGGPPPGAPAGAPQ